MWVRLILIFPVHALDLPEGFAVICTIDADSTAFEYYVVFATHGWWLWGMLEISWTGWKGVLVKRYRSRVYFA